MGKKVIIAGGGVAGLACAVFLNELNADLEIELYESSPKFGGRAYSFKDRNTGLEYDNGQHILAGWYKNTFEYLTAVGSYDKLNFQKSLEVNFIDENGEKLKLRSSNLPAPFSLLSGLKNFPAFDKEDKKQLKSLAKILYLSPEGGNALDTLKKLNQTNNLIKYFWEPFIYAVFNAKAENVCDKLFLNILKTGFLKPGNSSLVIPKVNLNELLINDALKYFENNGIKYHSGKGVEKFNVEGDIVKSLALQNGEVVTADFYISAVSFFKFTALFGKHQEFQKPSGLKPSSITSIHIFLNDDIPETMLEDSSFGMTGLLGKTVQWVFKRNSRHLSLVISGSDFIDDGQGDSITESEANEIYKIAYNDLKSSIKDFDKLEISGFKVIKEKRATFIPDNESENYRLDSKSHLRNLFIAGDWTNTGYPATIESAAASARNCVNLIEKLL